MIDFIDLKSQYQLLRADIEQRIQNVLNHGQYIMGPEVKELEGKLAAFTGSEHCISVSSGTEALLIALMAIGVKPGDEVITSSFTFVATAEVIALLGATPVFVDIEADTCNLDVKHVEQAISARTKAIIPVSLYGQVADMDELNAIASRYGVTVIEDAAQSFGATYRGKKSCNLSAIGCTSFFPSKPLGCYGDGGAIFTNDPDLAKAMREIRVHGQEKRYYHTRVGVGGRMDTIQCAITLAKMTVLDAELKARDALAERYMSALRGDDSLSLPTVRSDRSSAWAQFTLRVKSRDSFILSLQEKGIPTAVHYPIPLHQQPAYRNDCKVVGSLHISELVAKEVVSLPMHPYMNDADFERIVRGVLESV